MVIERHAIKWFINIESVSMWFDNVNMNNEYLLQFIVTV